VKPHRVFFFLLLVLLPIQLGYHLWPDWTYVLGRQVDYLSPTIFLTDILTILVLSFWFFERPLGIKYQVSSIWKYVLPLVIFAILNIFFAASWQVAAYKWVKVLEFGLLGWYVVKTKPDPPRITQYLSYGVLFSSLLAIAQFLLQRSVGGPMWFLGERTFAIDTPGIARTVLNGREYLRPYGTFPHPNVLGGYLAAALPLAMWQISNLKAQNSKLYYGITVALGLIALVLTFGRSAWIVVALAIAYVLAKQKRKILFTIPLLFLVGFVLLRPTLGDETIVVRQELNAAAVRLWTVSPLVGVGLGNFLVRLPETLPSRQIYFLQPVHNIYLLVLAETGVVGLAMFALLIWRGVRNQGSPIILVSLVALLLLGFVDHYPATLQQGQLLLTLLLALALMH
jgi:hypothetical protein